MNSEQFSQVFDHQMKMCSEVLFNKATEYATDDDRMHNFNTAAKLTGETPVQALAGFMVKHTISIYDMVAEDPNSFSEGTWDEKITDHINYLILLQALLLEARSKMSIRADSITAGTITAEQTRKH